MNSFTPDYHYLQLDNFPGDELVVLCWTCKLAVQFIDYIVRLVMVDFIQHHDELGQNRVGQNKHIPNIIDMPV